VDVLGKDRLKGGRGKGPWKGPLLRKRPELRGALFSWGIVRKEEK